MVEEFSIRFVNLGITIEELSKGISIFGFEVAFYGIIIGLGILLGILMAVREAKITGQNADDYYDLAIYAIIFAILGARIYYVIFEWDYYKDNLAQVINLRAGGLAIYGGIIASVITLIIFAKKKKLSPYQMLDTAVLGLVLGQIIGRWGNFINREAFGGFTENLFAMQLRRSEVYAGNITQEIIDNIVTVNGIEYIQVHPTFLYESMWNIGVLILLMIYKKHKKFHGEVFCLYLIFYGIGRAWIEGLRTDQLQLYGFAVSQVLSVTLVIVVSIYLIVRRKNLKNNK
ncbi:MAG: prolipoprotein diacylglyceryl transferase [Clostridiales bacterium]|nr:prolipoprotein diacylglyceryl transferase [Clostridiales bacterium]